MGRGMFKRMSRRAQLFQQLQLDILNDEQKEIWNKFIEWQNENVPRVAEMDEPLTLDDVLLLMQEFKSDHIIKILEAMHNYKPLLRNNVSAYLTARNWLQRDANAFNEAPQQQIQFSETAKKIHAWRSKNSPERD